MARRQILSLSERESLLALPSVTDSGLFTSISMNSAGSSRPRSGCAQRTSASQPMRCPLPAL